MCALPRGQLSRPPVPVFNHRAARGIQAAAGVALVAELLVSVVGCASDDEAPRNQAGSPAASGGSSHAGTGFGGASAGRSGTGGGANGGQGPVATGGSGQSGMPGGAGASGSAGQAGGRGGSSGGGRRGGAGAGAGGDLGAGGMGGAGGGRGCGSRRRGRCRGDGWPGWFERRGRSGRRGGSHGAVRHLRSGQHALRCGAQHGARALRRLRRQALSGAARLGQDDQGHQRPHAGAASRTPPRKTPSARARPAPFRSSTTSPARTTTSRSRPRVATVAPTSPRTRPSLKLTVGGHTVYANLVAAGVGYRNNSTSGIATGNGAEGEYMVASGTHVNDGCCFDYGNAETNNKDTGNGHHGGPFTSVNCAGSRRARAPARG